MSAAWNVGAAIQWIVRNSGSRSQGRCARYVRMAIEAGGLSTAGRPVAAKDYVSFLPKIGFNPLGSISGRDKQASWSSSNAQQGDIAVMNHGQYGHICMWVGDQWISDFKQRNRMWVYQGDGVCNLFRFGGSIDNTLGPINTQEGVTFDADGNMLMVSSGSYIYDEERDNQKDNILVKDIAEIFKQILKECVLDDLYACADVDKKEKMDIGDYIPDFDDVDDVQYMNELTIDDSSISESIVEKMVVNVSDGISSVIGVGSVGAIGEIMNIQAVSPGETGLSEQMLDIICMYETGHKFGYTMTAKDLNGYDLGDAGGHRTFGYGLLNHPNGRRMDTIKQSYSQTELETLYLNMVKQMVGKVQNWKTKNNVDLNQNQIDAITSACYNFGPGFLNKPICKMIAANPNNPAIKNTWEHLSDVQGAKYPGLIKRRRFEAAWYFGGK